jgi:hypothetical protein
MYEITLDFPDRSKGDTVEIDGLGVFENGYSYTVSDEEAEAFRLHHTTQQHEWDKDGNMTTTTEKGPTLLQAFQGNDSVDVVVAQKPQDDDEEVDS